MSQAPRMMPFLRIRKKETIFSIWQIDVYKASGEMSIRRVRQLGGITAMEAVRIYIWGRPIDGLASQAFFPSRQDAESLTIPMGVPLLLLVEMPPPDL